MGSYQLRWLQRQHQLWSRIKLISLRYRNNCSLATGLFHPLNLTCWKVKISRMLCFLTGWNMSYYLNPFSRRKTLPHRKIWKLNFIQFYVRFGPLSTLIRRENGAFQNAREWRNLKTMVLRLSEDGNHFWKGASRKRWHHANLEISLFQISPA